ncbi:hypothetical protein Q0601_04770 [Paracoccus onubensis]|uniref:hypothetical protein n=1 Tax=Paracoccus onubensis TaxID=1675788 RepID=UPI00272F5FB4|nr:hypothetical protein [Paracoccus onubensis]MDP0926479.1 hypothetical protein [Paracoccus onubensis]
MAMPLLIAPFHLFSTDEVALADLSHAANPIIFPFISRKLAWAFHPDGENGENAGVDHAARFSWFLEQFSQSESEYAQ